MPKMKSEKVPLVRFQSSHSPQSNASTALKNQDFKSFCTVLETQLDSNGECPLPDDHWLNQPIEGGDGDEKTFLVYSIEDVDDPQFCRKLVSVGANANLYDELLDQGPIHVAVNVKSAEKVRCLIENENNRADINAPIQPSGQNPLHLAAENGLEEVLEVLLEDGALAPNLNARDSFNSTPLYLAVKAKAEGSVRILMRKGADINAKCGTDNKTIKQVLRDYIPNFDLSSPSTYLQQPSYLRKTPEDLNQLMLEGNFVSFKYGLKYVDKTALSETVIGTFTLLQRACSEGLANYVKVLLDYGVDPNYSKSKSWRPVFLGAGRGHANVLIQLKEHSSNKHGHKPVRFDTWTEDGEETVLHLVLKKSLSRALQFGVGSEKDVKEIDQRYQESLEIFLQNENPDFNHQMRHVVNKRDKMGNTPLHYATTSGWSQNIVRKLLDLGANIGVRNWRDEIPLSRIHPQTLADFLDEECLQASGDLDADDDVKVTFKYSFLAPPISEDQLAKWDPEKQAELEREALPETNCVWYLSRSPAHRHLVTHPVVTSFLWLKWQRIRRFFNLNLRFYSLFVACLTWYIFARFAGHEWNGRVIHLDEDEVKDGNLTSPVPFCSDILWQETGQRYGFWYIVFVIHCVIQVYLIGRDWMLDAGTCIHCNCNYSACCAGWIDLIIAAIMGLVIWGASGILWLALTCLLALMVFREFFQMVSSFRRYLASVENWIEVALVVMVFVIVYLPEETLEDGCNAKRCLSAIVILLSWAELITMVGRHPRLSLYNKYVTMFYKVLQSFFSFLLWYSFFLAAFGLGFYIMLHNDISPKDEPSEYVFFDSPWLALVKTSTMFIGELEFSDIPINRENPVRAVLGFLFLLAFVFLIVVVLMNLLNGLAVSDTAAIEREAEIICHISKAETISYAESVLLGDPFDFLADWTAPNKRGCRVSASCFSAFPAIKDFAQKMTGATGILLFYSYLTEKQVEMPLVPDRSDGDCCYEMGCRRTSKIAEKMRTDAECRDILRAARKIIVDRRDKLAQAENESSISNMLKQLLEEQKILRQLISKQNEELIAIKKSLN